MKKRFIGILAVAACTLCIGGVVSKPVQAQAAEYTFNDANWLAVDPEIDPLEEGEFTLAVFGDTQKAIEYYPETVKNSMYWLVENKTDLNLQYVISVGDIMDDVNKDFNANSKPEEQLTAARDSYTILKDNGIPFTLTLGNHDYGDMAFDARDTTAFDEYFPLSFYDGMSTLGGVMGDSLENSYHFFEQGGTEYMIISLGHHPTDEILEWANGVIQANPTKKVIIAEHGYLDAGECDKDSISLNAGGYGARTPHGENIWNQLVSKYENVCMVLCGHELGTDQWRIVRSVAYGENGNAVHQIMTNPADIEYGGAGMIMLMTFRNDGMVEVNYYNPTADKYYGAHNQFSFILESTVPENLPAMTMVGNTCQDNVDEIFTAYSLGSTDYIDASYGHSMVELTANGLVAKEDGASIVYKMSAGENELFRRMRITVDYTSTAENGGFAVATSTDGENYQLFGATEGVSQSAKPMGSAQQMKFAPKDAIYGNREVYVKVIFLEGSVDNIAISRIQIQTTDATAIMDDNGQFGVHLDFSQYENYAIDAWDESTISNHNLLTFDGMLGTGRRADYAGAKGWAEWEFIAPMGTSIDSLAFNASGRTTSSVEMDYALKLEVSLDKGKTYESFAEEGYEGTKDYSYNLSSKVKGAQSVRLRLTLWGDYWHSVGLKTLNISGSYRYGITYHNGQAEGDNPSDYTVNDQAIDLAAAVAPEYYLFDGWYTTADFSGERWNAIPAGTSGALDLYAKFKPISYNIAYSLSGGKNSVDNPATYESYKGLSLAAASRNGYTFAGWYTTSDFSGEKVETIIAGTTGDVQLYAKFLRNYRITYIVGDGTLENKIESFTEEDNFALPTPTREGYDFGGWYTDAAFQNELKEIAKGTKAPVVVYAKWEKKAVGESQNNSSSAQTPQDAKEEKSGCTGSVGSGIVVLTLLGLAILRKKDENE